MRTNQKHLLGLSQHEVTVFFLRVPRAIPDIVQGVRPVAVSVTWPQTAISKNSPGG